MRFVQSSSDSQSVSDEMRKVLKRQAELWSKVLRINVVVTPTARNDLTFLKRSRTFKDYIRLCLVHWYLPEEAFALVHWELEQQKNKFGTDNSGIAHMLLNSEPEMVLYLLESSQCFKTERELFGFLHNAFDFSKYHFFVCRARKPKKVVRRRGYNDQGSRRLPHEQHEPKYDYTFDEEQNRIEEERQALQDAIELARGWNM